MRAAEMTAQQKRRIPVAAGKLGKLQLHTHRILSAAGFGMERHIMRAECDNHGIALFEFSTRC